MEVEIKARIDNPAEIEKRLKKLGAIFQGEEEEVDIYFSHPSRDFKVTDEALRIRNGKILTYKGPKVDSDTKSREEIEVEVDSGERMEALLIRLGFRPVAKVTKIRRKYLVGDVHVSLDHLAELGDFVEIECIGEYEKSRHKVLQMARVLGLSRFIRESYLELLLKKKES